MSADYYEVQPQNQGRWLQGKYGRAWMQCFGLIKAAMAAVTKIAVKSRFSDYVADNGLARTGVTYQIERGYAATPDVYRKVQANAWTLWQNAGTIGGMMAALDSISYPLANITMFGVIVPTVRIWEKWQLLEDNPERWWRFWIVLRPPFPWTNPIADGNWSSGGNWNDGGLWAGIMPNEAERQLVRTVNKWRSFGKQCSAVIVLFSGELWDDPPGLLWDDASGDLWDGQGAYLTP